MKIAIVVQARMTSTRLPGKVLMTLGGRPMLAQQIRRLRQCERAGGIWIATTGNASDDPIADLARAEQVGCFRGGEHDVLSRYVGAARAAGADAVVRVTGDCPFLDPAVVDRVIAELVEHASECDYASNVLERTYPRGLDVEAFWLDTLLRMDRLARSAAGVVPAQAGRRLPEQFGSALDRGYGGRLRSRAKNSCGSGPRRALSRVAGLCAREPGAGPNQSRRRDLGSECDPYSFALTPARGSARDT